MKQYTGESTRVEFNVPVDMMDEAEMRQLLKAILVRASGDDTGHLHLFDELTEAEFLAFGQEGQITAADMQEAFDKALRASRQDAYDEVLRASRRGNV